MTSLIESIRKGPLLTMILRDETDYPRALKDIMLSLGLKGEVVYKGFPVMDECEEYWWVQVHIYENKEDDHETCGLHMFADPILHTSFFESARCAAWKAIRELGWILRTRLHNTQKYLKVVEAEVEALKEDMAREKCKTNDKEDME